MEADIHSKHLPYFLPINSLGAQWVIGSLSTDDESGADEILRSWEAIAARGVFCRCLQLIQVSVTLELRCLLSPPLDTSLQSSAWRALFFRADLSANLTPPGVRFQATQCKVHLASSLGYSFTFLRFIVFQARDTAPVVFMHPFLGLRAGNMPY